MMAGWILLEGGAEFQGQMAAPDRRALELAGGESAPLVILPTAAAPDHNHNRAGNNGVRWFERLGARNVSALAVIDRASANQPELAQAVRAAGMVYLLGGFTHYLGQTLAGSLCLQAAQAAYQAGALIAGSSAGAMVLCEHYFNPEAGRCEAGLGFVRNACVIPHHNTFGKAWAARLAGLLPGVVLVGIDEQTGMINDAPLGQWTVYGRGAVTLYRDGKPEVHPSGASFGL
jgi:cyanophycinase